ncbi:hypothetical protein M3181_19215 [Mesobacillus maritimus]|uniref:hypothetical protein n=1 Tax=Mesobacillus maritimus TaxID=1643336 RepID=UPI002041FF9A|nr:hypothetical protein [Mesobacillus maritimus]MCM3671093.1 hypothetical protein [Mesobacillus maritimus]
MKKITDERLILQNLQHIRITYIVQTIGILCILGYEFFQDGLEPMRENPLWLVFMLTTVVYAYLSMSVSVVHEKGETNPRKSFLISLIVLSLIVVVAAILTAMTPGFGWGNGAFIGGVLYVCGFIPCYYVYHLRKKQRAELDEDE